MEWNKKAFIAIGAAVGITLSVVAGFYINRSFSSKFQENLISAIEAATGIQVLVQGAAVNMVTGNGSVDIIALNDTSLKDKNLIEIHNVTFSFSVPSVFDGPLRIENIQAGPVGIDVNIVGTGYRVGKLLQVLREKSKLRSQEDTDIRVVLEQMDLGEGRLNVGTALLGTEISRTFPFSGAKLAAIGENEGGVTPVELVRKIVIATGLNALKASGF